MAKEYRIKKKRDEIYKRFNGIGIQRLYKSEWLYGVLVVDSFE